MSTTQIETDERSCCANCYDREGRSGNTKENYIWKPRAYPDLKDQSNIMSLSVDATIGTHIVTYYLIVI